jgi:hypothetical protein
MAEIKIEKKKPVWPWLLAGLLLVVLILFLVMRDDRRDGYVAGDRDTTEQRVGDRDAVEEYVQYVEDGSMDEHHEYTSGAFSRLIRAVRAKANEVNHDISADLEQANESVNRITNDPTETNHANNIKNAADRLTRAMGNLQQARFENLDSEMEDVREAADSIDPNVLTLDQKDEVNSFLNNSADLLKKMN